MNNNYVRPGQRLVAKYLARRRRDCAPIAGIPAPAPPVLGVDGQSAIFFRKGLVPETERIVMDQPEDTGELPGMLVEAYLEREAGVRALLDDLDRQALEGEDEAVRDRIR